MEPRSLPELPKQAQSLLEALGYQARVQPNAAAFVLLEQEREVALPTYSELLLEARKISSGLRAQGVRPGDRVALMLPTCVDFFTAFFGILNAGAIAVPLYPPVRLDQFEDFLSRQDAILSNCQAEVLITMPQLGPVIEVVKQRTGLRLITSARELGRSTPADLYPAGSDEVALLQYTSGSTGHPKGVPLTHHNLLTNIWAIGKGFAMGDNDVMVSWLPLYHDMGLIGTCLGSFVHGLPLVLMGPEQFLGRPGRWIRAFSRYRGTMTAAPNFAYAICAKKVSEEELEGVDLSCWRIALNGAEPIVPSTVRAFLDRFAPYGFQPGTMFSAYGLAEATLAVTFNPLGRGLKTISLDRDHLSKTGEVVSGSDEVASCGVLLDGVELRIADDQGALPEGRQGHVELRGDSVMSGYYGYPERGEWLRPGDLGFLWEGELYITGRTRDLIVVGGRNLHPNDLEAAVGLVPGVRPGCVAALGVESSEGTQRLLILAEARKGSGDELRNKIQEAVQKTVGMAAEIVLLPPRTLPKTPSGKIRRQESKRRYLESSLDPPRWRWKSLARALKAWGKAAPARVRHYGRGAWCWSWMLKCWFDLVVAKRPVGASVRALLRRLGIKLAVRGTPFGAGPVMVVANHASLLDSLLLLAAWEGEPLRFVIGESSAGHPLLGRLARQHISVRRGLGQAQDALTQMVSALQAGSCMAVFPEGGIEFSSGLRGFATGPFQACAQADSRLQPVAIAGRRQILPQGQWVAYPGNVEVTFLEVMTASDPTFEAAATLSRQARAAIAGELPERCWETRLARRD